MNLLDILIFNKLKQRRGGITPTGTIEITEDGTYDVTNYANANVSVSPYQFLDYIEASGGQYVITNILPKNVTKIKMKFRFTQETGNAYLFGAKITNDLGVVISMITTSMNFANSSKKFELGWSNSWISSTKRLDINTDYEMEFNYQSGMQEIKINDEIILSDTRTIDFSQFPNNLPYSLLALNSDKTISASNTPIRFYGCQMYDSSNNLVGDFKPAKIKNSGIVGIWDNVSSLFLENAGTGSFTPSL